MNLSSNIQRLRRGNDMSQEQLADVLDVSRQAVSRWESGDSVPEIDKLMRLSELFGVSMDELVQQAGVENAGSGTDVAARKAKFDQTYQRFANAVAGSVGLIMFSLVPVVLLGDAYESAALFFLGAIVIAVPTIVYHSIMLKTVRDEMGADLATLYTTHDAITYARPFAAQLVSGLCLILLSVVYVVAVQMLIGNGGAERWAPAGMFIGMAVGVMLIVRGSILRGRFERVRMRTAAANADTDNPLVGKTCGTIMLSATLIFLLCGFLGDLWSSAWIVFPVGGILCGIISIIFGKDSTQQG